MRADSGCELALLRADGGASRNGLLMQLQADALQVTVTLTPVAISGLQGTLSCSGVRRRAGLLMLLPAHALEERPATLCSSTTTCKGAGVALNRLCAVWVGSMPTQGRVRQARLVAALPAVLLALEQRCNATF